MTSSPASAFPASPDAGVPVTTGTPDTTAVAMPTVSDGPGTTATIEIAAASFAPLPPSSVTLPCIEQPARCILTSRSYPNRRLTSTKKGGVHTARSRGEKEQWFLLPAMEGSAARKAKSAFYFKSYKFGRYLTTDAEAKAFRTTEPDHVPTQAEAFLLIRSPHGGHFLVSADHEINVGCAGASGAVVGGTGGLLSDDAESESWDVELVTGELCFITSPLTLKQIRCDMMGKLSGTADRRGWEVWRFIESGEGKVRICSWMHSQHFLCCDGEGRVRTCSAGGDEIGEGWDKWTVERAPTELPVEGVFIKSQGGRLLCFDEDKEEGEMGADGGGLRLPAGLVGLRIGNVGVVREGGRLYTVDEFRGETTAIWQLDAAHSQKYSIASVHHDKNLIGPFPYLTDKAKQADQWTLELVDEEGTVKMYLPSQERYLESSPEGEISKTSSVEHSQLWRMSASSQGGYTFTSIPFGRLLSFSDNGAPNPELCTVRSVSDIELRAVWRLDPILPRAISSGKIKTFAIGTSIAVGTTIAMPFAMAGVAGLIGTEMTVLANMVTVGLTSAEAIASVGAIGATAAIVFRESSDTLGIESEEADEIEEKPYTKRPLCAWRSW